MASTYVSERVPVHERGRIVVLLESFWGLGWLCAALISYFIIPHYDWHAAFLVGGLPARLEAARRQARRGQWRHKALPLGCRGRHAASRLRRVEIRTSKAHLSKLTMPRDTPRT